MKKKKSGNANWRQWNVAVTGVNARAENPGPGCAVARSIKEHSEFRGNIIGLGYDMLDAGLYARDICSGGYLIPYPSAGADTLLDRLMEVHERERLDAVIPCLDAEILNFIAIRDDLERAGIRTYLPRREQFQLRAKNQLAEFCAGIGLNTPETKAICDARFFDSCEKEGWSYPLVVKGIFYDAAIVNDPLEAKAVFHRLVAAWGYPVLIQKVVKGHECDLSAVGDGNGNLLAPVTMRKRALTDKGKAWAGVTVSDPGIQAFAERLIAALRWRGPFEVEVMIGDDDQIYLIEMNPRFPSWIYLSHAAGRNLPVMLLKLMSSAVDAVPPLRTGTMFIRYAQEVTFQMDDFEKMLVDGSIPANDLISRSA